MSESKRIELLEIIKKDENVLRVGFVAELFGSTLDMLDKDTQTFKNIKEKLGEDQYIRMMTSLANSFLSTLYINGAKDNEEQFERLKLVNKVNKDLTTYKRFKEDD